MKFQFKIQGYQTEAVENTVKVFAGQSAATADSKLEAYRVSPAEGQLDYGELYYRNAAVKLNADELLRNIRTMQRESGIPLSKTLSLPSGMGACSLDIEMETGMGKTYVYIKTIFELNARYGWSSFIVVVPSIAIREGVKKSFLILEEHFMGQYGKKLRCFVYDSANLAQLSGFSDGAGITVMIINTQAFAASLKEGGKSKESLIIYSERDTFQSRRPIDVIASSRPIIIMDEPQKMEGEATQKGLKALNPLFTLNYSATHKTRHNTVYALDALDAFRKRLVKRIEVKGFELKNFKGASGYLYLDSIILSTDEPPAARVELEVKRQGGIKRESRKTRSGADLFALSGLSQYKGFVLSEINPFTDTVTFLNGETLRKGEVKGDVSELDLQHVQIRETIRSHLEKEELLFERGIKTLSLFFIDEVAKYKSYSEDGSEEKGILQKIFEEEYSSLLKERIDAASGAYKEYLCRFSAEKVHSGYFSIDKKTSHAVDSKPEKKGAGISNDISAYELILRNKERLLNFDEPVRFVFSHSVLREGWDNPNVFQICTLRHSASEVGKRQEVGRGLRLCVNKEGSRMDEDALGDAAHDINRLTVIANESYSEFTAALQCEVRESLRERPQKATLDLFSGKTILLADGEMHEITENEAISIHAWLFNNKYIDDNGIVTDKYREDLAENRLAPFPERIESLFAGAQALVQSTFDETALLGEIVEDGNRTRCAENAFNKENAAHLEFKELWESINQKYAYSVLYESEELVSKAAAAINRELAVPEFQYGMTEGKQTDADVFEEVHSRTAIIDAGISSSARYDPAGEICRIASVTRRSAAAILKSLNADKLLLFRRSPEEFIKKAARITLEQKAAMVIEHISYHPAEGEYSCTIFMQEKRTVPADKAYAAKKHVLNYVFPDSEGERRFVKSLDGAYEVSVYAKLPRSFKIPTPVGNYSPDWAIAFNRDKKKHLFLLPKHKAPCAQWSYAAWSRLKLSAPKGFLTTLNPKRCITSRQKAILTFLTLCLA